MATANGDVSMEDQPALDQLREALNAIENLPEASEARVAAIYRSRVLLKDGLPIGAVEGGQVRRLADSDLDEPQLRTLLARRSLRHPLRPHLRAPSPRETEKMANARLATARERLRIFRV